MGGAAERGTGIPPRVSTLVVVEDPDTVMMILLNTGGDWNGGGLCAALSDC